MATKSTKPEWQISAMDFGKSLSGFGVNLLVSDMEASIAFARTVLLAQTLYWNEDFAVLKHGDTTLMLHADHTYQGHALSGFVKNNSARGQGVELRLYDLDPDKAEQRAKKADYSVLAGSMDKPHGLRECYILGPDGYCWVIGQAL